MGKIYSSDIEAYADRALSARFDTYESFRQDLTVLPSPQGEICRIIRSCGKTVVRARDDLRNELLNYLSSVDLPAQIREPGFHARVLGALGLNAEEYPLKPADEFVDISRNYRCIHTLEFVCSAGSFVPFEADFPVDEIHRGEDGFLLADNFCDTVYCIRVGEEPVSVSFYRPNHGVFEGTCAMQVSTRNEHRNKGYGKAVASAATADICRRQGLALWVCQAENAASIRLAETLGYIFLGGELRIVE